MSKNHNKENINNLKILFIKAVKEVLKNRRDQAKATGNQEWFEKHIYQKWIKNQIKK